MRVTTLLLCCLLLVEIGCGVSREARNQVAVAAAVSDVNFRDWTRLTEEEREEASWASARALADLDWSLNGRRLPALYEVDPFAARRAEREARRREEGGR